MENSELKKITNEAAKRGHEVRIRDIAYGLLRARFKDELIAYTVVFGVPQADGDVSCYDKLPSTKYLVKYFSKSQEETNRKKSDTADIVAAITKSKQDNADTEGAISFEDNRAGIETQLKEILELKKQCNEEDGKIDVKTMALLQKTEADLRVKLNDKFGAAEKTAEQYIIVQKKFDFICPATRRECYQLDKEAAMKKWNLIEKK